MDDRFCKHCGKKLERKVWANNREEPVTAFEERITCGRRCAAVLNSGESNRGGRPKSLLTWGHNEKAVAVANETELSPVQKAIRDRMFRGACR